MYVPTYLRCKLILLYCYVCVATVRAYLTLLSPVTATVRGGVGSGYVADWETRASAPPGGARE
jgi:hypothetical protein